MFAAKSKNANLSPVQLEMLKQTEELKFHKQLRNYAIFQPVTILPLLMVLQVGVTQGWDINYMQWVGFNPLFFIPYIIMPPLFLINLWAIPSAIKRGMITAACLMIAGSIFAIATYYYVFVVLE
jgi:cation transport ATPase